MLGLELGDIRGVLLFACSRRVPADTNLPIWIINSCVTLNVNGVFSPPHLACCAALLAIFRPRGTV